MSKYKQPASIYGIILKIDNMISKSGKEYKRIKLALSNGKDMVTKEYKPSTMVQVTYMGEALPFNVKDKATFSGNLDFKENTVGDKTYNNLSMLSFDCELESKQLPILEEIEW